MERPRTRGLLSMLLAVALAALGTVLAGAAPPAAAGTPCDPGIGLAGSAAGASGYASAIDVEGSYAYVADWSGIFEIFDVSDPCTPTLLPGSLSLGQELGDVQVAGNRAYLANDANGVRIVDISDRSAPAIIASRNDGTYAFDVAYDGSKYLFVAYLYTAGSEVKVYDVSADTLELVASYDAVGSRHVMALALDGNRLYLYSQNGTASFEVIDWSPSTTTLTRLGSFPWAFTSYGAPNRLAVQGDHVYVATAAHPEQSPPWPGGLAVVDVSDPTDPEVEGFAPVAAPATVDWRGGGVAVSGGLAYLVTPNGLLRIDISDPGNPTVLPGMLPVPPAFVPTKGGSVDLVGDYAFATYFTDSGGTGGLAVYRVQQAPTVDAGGPYLGQEGTAVPIVGTATNAASTTWSVAPGAGVDAGASCTIADPAALSTSVTCTDDGPWTLTLDAVGSGGGTATDTATLDIDNVAPVVTITDPAPGSVYGVGATVTVSGTATDAATNDTVTVDVDWGDGAHSTPAVVAGVFTADHSYGSAGTRTVTVTGTDDDGATDSATVGVDVVRPASRLTYTGSQYFADGVGTAVLRARVDTMTCRGGTVRFRADLDGDGGWETIGSGSINPLTGIASYRWNAPPAGVFDIQAKQVSGACRGSVRSSVVVKGVGNGSSGQGSYTRGGRVNFTYSAKVNRPVGEPATVTGTMTWIVPGYHKVVGTVTGYTKLPTCPIGGATCAVLVGKADQYNWNPATSRWVKVLSGIDYRVNVADNAVPAGRNGDFFQMIFDRYQYGLLGESVRMIRLDSGSLGVR